MFMTLLTKSSVGVRRDEVINRTTLKEKFNIRNTKVKLVDLEIHEGKGEHYLMKPVGDNNLEIYLIYR